MLTAEQIIDLAEANNIDASCYWEDSSKGHRLPKRTRINLSFKGVSPDAWFALMTNNTEVPVRCFGTRPATDNPSTDGRLHPDYAAMLPAVNARRAELELAPIRG